ncbi:MAG TPA: hypothetical protein P5137_17955, partial [Candidatus Brocadiia bacterium]|nr:hypothetical protein [Candidatus Brocadiia bacterium]
AWVMAGHKRGAAQGIVANRWASSGMNAPESNLWNGAALWRAAAMFPDDPQAAAWRAKARVFLVNSVCVPEDVGVVPGCVGGGFFSSYALDHHGYMNVGYMVICVSNAAILHFDLKGQGLERPAELDHHEADLWGVLRRMIFADGRLARIGGDTRVRYAYCQEYLLPALLYAADQLGDAHAVELANRQLELMAKEQRQNPDGSFYGKRLAELARHNPYYYTRLESDRACVLGMALAYGDLVKAPARSRGGFEASAAGEWIEPEHGAVLSRCATRLASFSWRAQGLGQGLCLPPDNGDLAEWEGNLTGKVVAACHPAPPHVNRRLGGFTISSFGGGFVTCGKLIEGEKTWLNEGWAGADAAEHWIAFAALPDGHTVAGLELVRIGSRRTYLTELQGLRLNVPNDLHAGFRRILTSESGAYLLDGPARQDEIVELRSRWACVEDRIAVLGLYGGDTLAVSRSSQRRGGMYHSLFTEEIGWPIMKETTAFDAGAVALDAGWAVAASVDSGRARKWAGENASARLELGGDLRGVMLRGLDGRDYAVVANFGSTAMKAVVAGAM